jgi:hypothetical protein
LDNTTDLILFSQISDVYNTVLAIFVAIISTVVFNVIITMTQPFKDDIIRPGTPIIYNFFVSYFLSTIFFDVYGMTVCTIIQIKYL